MPSKENERARLQAKTENWGALASEASEVETDNRFKAS
jgi:hypothetical protein